MVTEEQCDAKIAAFQAALDELALLPTRGSTGKTALDLSQNEARIKDRIEHWQGVKAALQNGGAAPRTERCC